MIMQDYKSVDTSDKPTAMHIIRESLIILGVAICGIAYLLLVTPS